MRSVLQKPEVLYTHFKLIREGCRLTFGAPLLFDFGALLQQKQERPLSIFKIGVQQKQESLQDFSSVWFRRTSATETGNPPSHKYERLAPSLRTNRLHGQKYLAHFSNEKRFTPSVRKSLSIRFRKPIKRIPLSIYWRTYPTKNHTRVVYTKRYFQFSWNTFQHCLTTCTSTPSQQHTHIYNIHTILCHKKNAKEKNKGLEI